MTPLRDRRARRWSAGLPPGVLNVVPGDGETGAALAGHPGIDQITFTGSVATGIKVAQAAAANVVPSVVELGGKSPGVVFADADVDLALRADRGARSFSNAGQTCSAGTRLLLASAVAEEFLDRLVAARRVAAARPGPGRSGPRPAGRGPAARPGRGLSGAGPRGGRRGPDRRRPAVRPGAR